MKDGHCSYEFLRLAVEGETGEWSEHHFGQVGGHGTFLLCLYVLLEERQGGLDVG